MLESGLYAWLVVRFLLSVAIGMRAANRLRHDAATQGEFARMVGYHLVGSAVTWMLEALVHFENMPAAGPAAGPFVFPFALLWTIWVPLVDALGFLLVSSAIAIVLVRQRLTRYRDELLLGEPEQRVRAARACEFLSRLARSAEPELLEVMGDPDAELRFRAARALGRIRPLNSTAALECLRRALTDRDSRVRLAAACALALLNESDPAVLAGVVAALAVEDDELRGEGMRAVSPLGPAAGAECADRVVALVDHWKFGWLVPATLMKIGEAAIPALTSLLQNPKARVRHGAALGLGRLGAAAGPAVPELVHLSKFDADRTVRQIARTALKAIRKDRPMW